MPVHERRIPPDAHTAEEAHEILRGWLIDGCLQCSLLPSAFPEPFGWGIFLADVAHHVANALAESEGTDRTQALQAITRAFNVEMRTPTDHHTGEYVDPDK
ncbi:MAG: DUF5076 domain-containing protein [Rhizobiales bacterium]|nr:DUF5076 domain-containing protein [Hyphomicrobiales bacterium]